MIVLKVRKVGNSVGVLLPQEVTSALKVDEGDMLFLTEAKDGFRLTPYDPDFERQMQVAQRVMRRNRNVLRALAKA
ncbi:MAG: AbrB/MazE/SpoVT family DNA-binding domain-containing protein [Xanthobacteraceae bacterium]